jgi:hypothetical protein
MFFTLKHVDTIAFYQQEYRAPKYFYHKLVKAQISRKCLQPDVSMASAAVRYGIKATWLESGVSGWQVRYQTSRSRAIWKKRPRFLSEHNPLTLGSACVIDISI